MTEFIGKRFKLDSFFGTVLFYGQVPENSGKYWLGVEWDDPSRGKHDGTHEGIKYFNCKNGSFLKPSSKISFGKDLNEAIKEKYYSDGIMNYKTESDVQLVGIEKILKKLDLIVDVGLIDCEVSFCDIEKSQRVYTSVKSLDLSQNLVSSWKEVDNILVLFPNINALCLNSNRFTSTSSNGSDCIHTGLKTLVLNFTLIDFDEFLYNISSRYPNLESLHLSKNEIEILNPISNVSLLTNLRRLDLSYNKLCDWNQLESTIGQVPTLESLNLEGNLFMSIIHRIDSFKTLKELIVSKNSFPSYKFISELDKFDSLENLRASGLKIFESMRSSEVRFEFVARVANLRMFNGSQVTTQERRDTELYYIDKIFKEMTDTNKQILLLEHPRYLKLVDFYGEPTKTEKLSNSIKSNLVQVTFSVGSGPPKLKQFPKSTTVKLLKLYYQKISKVPLNKITLKVNFEKEQQNYKIEMDDDLKSLDYFGIGDSCNVEIGMD